MFSQFKGVSIFDDLCVAFEPDVSDFEFDSVVFEYVFHVVCVCAFVAEVDFAFSCCEPEFNCVWFSGFPASGCQVDVFFVGDAVGIHIGFNTCSG